MIFGYLLEHTDQTFDRIRDFKALIENQSRFKIKMLRSDNWDVYNSNEFNNYYAKYMIKR